MKRHAIIVAYNPFFFFKITCLIMLKCPIKSVMVMMTHRYVIPLIKKKRTGNPI